MSKIRLNSFLKTCFCIGPLLWLGNTSKPTFASEPSSEASEEEEEMSTAEQLKAMRAELGLSVHSLHDAGVESEVDSEDERWQCVRVMREFAGLER